LSLICITKPAPVVGSDKGGCLITVLLYVLAVKPQLRKPKHRTQLTQEVLHLRKLKLYLDTSTISHLFADDTPDKMADTNNLWEEVD
jgi:hypothetical protein